MQGIYSVKKDDAICNLVCWTILREPVLNVFRFLNYDSGIQFYTVVFLLFFVRVIIYVLMSKCLQRVTKSFIISIAIVSFIILNCMRSNVEKYVVDEFATLVFFYLTTFLVIPLLRNKKLLNRKIEYTIGIHYILGIIICIAYIETGRGYSAEAMIASYMIALPTACILFYAMISVKRSIISILLCIIGIALALDAGSRGVIFVFLFSVFLGLNSKRYTQKDYILGVCFTLFIMLVIFNLEEILSLLSINVRIIKYLGEKSFFLSSGRIQIWSTILEGISESPLIGWGTYGDRYLTGWAYAHNLFLEVFCSYGILVGILFLIWFVKKSYKMLVKLKDKKAIYLFILAIPRLLVSSSILQSGYFWVYFGILLTIEDYRNEIAEKDYNADNLIRKNCTDLKRGLRK